MKIDGATVHGFRSSFRDWAGNSTDFPREVVETALAHVIGDRAEQAYRRSDALEKRRKLMEAWAQYCSAGSDRSDRSAISAGRRTRGWLTAHQKRRIGTAGPELQICRPTSPPLSGMPRSFNAR